MNVELSPIPVWVAPVAALGAALVSAVAVRGSGARAARSSGRIVAAGVALALVVLLVVGRGVLSGAGVYSHALRLFRIGSLDATLGFFVDGPRLALAVAVVLWGLLGSLVAPASGASPRARTSLGAATGCLLAMVLAEGVPTFALGLGAFGLAAAPALGVRAPRAAARALGGIFAAVLLSSLASAFVFWGVGGRFLDGRRYLSDYQAPFEVSTKVKTEGPQEGVLAPKVGEKSYLTMVTRPGAKIYLGLANESQLTPRVEPFAIAPVVRAEVPAGLQKLAIDPGGGTILGGDGRDIATIEQARFPGGEVVELRANGPSLSFREIAPVIEKSPTAFGERALDTLRIADVAVLALGLAAIALVLAAGGEKREEAPIGPTTLVGAGLAFAAAALSVHFGPVFAASPRVACAAALAVLGLALLSGLRARRARGAGELVASAARAAVGLVVATGLVASSAAVVSAAIGVGLGLAALGAVLEAPALLSGVHQDDLVVKGAGLGEGTLGKLGTAFALGTVAVAGVPVPGVGVFLGVGALGGAALSRGVTGIAVALVGAAAWAALSASLYRGYYCMLHAPRPPQGTPEAAPEGDEARGDAPKKGKSKKRAKSAAPPVAATQPKTDAARPADRAAELLGALGAIGGAATALALGVLAEPRDQSLAVRLVAILLVAAPAAITGHLARVRYGARRAQDWLAREPRADEGTTSADVGERLGAAVLALDRLLSAPLELLTRRSDRDGGGAS
jgi:hypothetical protein